MPLIIKIIIIIMPLDWEYRFDSHHPHMVRAPNDTETAWPLKTFSPLQNQTRITNSHRVRLWLNPQTRKKAKQWIADRIGGSKSTNPKNPNTTSLRTAQREMDCDSDSQISTSPKIKNRSWASRFAEEPRFTETIRVTTLTLPHIPTWWKFCRNKVSFVRFSFWSTRFVFLMVSFFFYTKFLWWAWNWVWNLTWVNLGLHSFILVESKFGAFIFYPKNWEICIW